MPVDAYVSERAYSAAALISLTANKIVMAPGASIGAAEPIPATVKMVSALRGEFESTAQRNHRSPQIAGAMVDKNVSLPQYKRSGAILTLNTDDAVRSGIASGTAPTFAAALDQFGLGGAQLATQSYTLGETIARFATDPVVSGLLLTLGMLGLLIEMQTLHGIAGVIGVGALALFFGSHVYAGFSNAFVVALAVVGLVGILWELHVVPGHALPGIIGAGALLVAVLLAFGLPFFFVGIETIATAIVLTVIAFSLTVKAVPQNAWAHRLALAASQGSDYVEQPRSHGSARPHGHGGQLSAPGRHRIDRRAARRRTHRRRVHRRRYRRFVSCASKARAFSSNPSPYKEHPWLPSAARSSSSS